MPYNTSDYHYDLPQELIAQKLIHPHHDARLLVVDKSNGEILSESTFYELDAYIPPNRVLFFNNSRVIPSRLRLKECSFIHIGGHEWVISDGEIFSYQREVILYWSARKTWKQIQDLNQDICLLSHLSYWGIHWEWSNNTYRMRYVINISLEAIRWTPTPSLYWIF